MAAPTDRTVRESVQPLRYKQNIYQQLAVANTAENIAVDSSEGMEEWRVLCITTDKDIFLAFDVGAAVTLSDANAMRLLRFEEYYEVNVRVESRLRFVNIVGGEQPTIRGIAWGE